MKRRPKKDYTKKVPLQALAAKERKVGEIVDFSIGRYYTVVRISLEENLAYLRQVGPLE